jgi:hypothetical protein
MSEPKVIWSSHYDPEAVRAFVAMLPVEEMTPEEERFVDDHTIDRDPMPVFKSVGGRTREISGRAAEEWHHPRTLNIGGTRFEETPPLGNGWHITRHYMHAVWAPRNPLMIFAHQYIEGRSSGFPFWPTVAYSVRAAANVTWRRIFPRPAPNLHD